MISQLAAPVVLFFLARSLQNKWWLFALIPGLAAGFAILGTVGGAFLEGGDNYSREASHYILGQAILNTMIGTVLSIVSVVVALLSKRRKQEEPKSSSVASSGAIR